MIACSKFVRRIRSQNGLIACVILKRELVFLYESSDYHSEIRVT